MPHPNEERILEIDVHEAEADPLERRRWRQYACAALTGALASETPEWTSSSVRTRSEAVREMADEMLKQERERFEKVTP